jgi:hypothetical protein
MAEDKKYRVYLDRPNKRVHALAEDTGTTTTASKYEALNGFTLEEAKANILTVDPLFDVSMIDIQIERDKEQE